jgi:uncharacterized protein (TIGR02646 family)
MAMAEWAASEFFASRSRGNRQREYTFDPEIYAAEAVLKSLRALFSNRCAFCTQAVGLRGVSRHFRPPQDAVGLDGSVSRRHYHWLAYDWRNLYLACQDCGEAQGAKFPVEGTRAGKPATEDALPREDPLLLDPCAEDPEQVLVYLRSGEVVSRHRRGVVTIETFQLNRPALVSARRLATEATQIAIRRVHRALQTQAFADAIVELTTLYDRDEEFAGVRRQFVNQWVQGRARQIEHALSIVDAGIPLATLTGDLRRVTTVTMDVAARVHFGVSDPTRDAQTGKPATSGLDAETLATLGSLRIDTVEIRNFRAIEHLRVAMADAGPGGWMMLLGENGAGKSSVLHAIALALSDAETIDKLRLDARAILRQGADEGHVRVAFTSGRRQTVLRFNGRSRRFKIDPVPQPFLLAGYGPTRLLPRRGVRTARGSGTQSSIANLFNPFTPLAEPRDWLPELTPNEFGAVARALKRVLLLTDEEELVLSRAGTLELMRSSSRLGLDQLSDGYQAMAAFALDLMRPILERWGSPEAAEGIVLIDELGSHLHPRWQMEVTRALRQAFPRMQVIATTHDPLCLRGIRNGEVVVLRRGRDDSIYPLRDLPPVEGLAVDELLTSEHFGLSSTIDADLQAAFDEYYDLLARRRRIPEDEQRLTTLRSVLAHRRLLGATERERLVLEAADEFLAKAAVAASEDEHRSLKAATRRRLRELWAEVA